MVSWKLKNLHLKNVEKGKLSQRVGHKVMGLNHLIDMTAKLPTFKI